MRVVILGSRGFIGRYLLGVFPDALRPEVDIADARAVASCLKELMPEMVINAAGRTGHPNVDWCEENKLQTLLSNVTGPLVLLDACAKRGIYWVHMSSGCIYEGDNGGKGFSEEDPPNFSGSFYARTKGWTDQILREFARPAQGRGGVLQVRLRMPFDGSQEARNLLVKLRKYPRVLDEPNSLTYVPDFLKALKRLTEKRCTGIYNVVNPGVISPYQIMVRYRQLVDPSVQFERLTVEGLPQVVRAGRSNCVLSVSKLEAEGITLKPVAEAVDESLKAFLARAR